MRVVSPHPSHPLIKQSLNKPIAGRNVSYLELLVSIATLARRYEFEFVEPGFELQTADTVNAHPLAMPMKIRRRNLSPDITGKA